MVKPTPMRFNPDLLVRETTEYQVQLPLSQFSRLCELLLEPNGEMQAVFRLTRLKKLIQIKGRIQADFTLECQRCVEPMTCSIDEQFTLVFVDNEDAAKAMPEEYDPVILAEDGLIHVVDLFEDELILHVPIVPRHTHSDVCIMRDVSFGEVDEASSDKASDKANPFSVLKKLDVN